MAMNNENEYEAMIYTLEDENGEEINFELLDTLELNNTEYYAFIPYQEETEDMETNENEEEWFILKKQTVDEEDLLVTIDDEAEYDQVSSLLLQQITEKFDLSDEDLSS